MGDHPESVMPVRNRGVCLAGHGSKKHQPARKQHHGAENGHDGRDDAERHLRGGLRDRGYLVPLARTRATPPNQPQRGVAETPNWLIQESRLCVVITPLRQCRTVLFPT